MSWPDDVLAWHDAMGLDCSGDPRLGYQLVCEEGRELTSELRKSCNGYADRADILKESLDLVWVVIGNLNRHGISPDQVEAGWRELCRSNASKVGAPRDANGKLQKGPNYSPADMARVLGGGA